METVGVVLDGVGWGGEQSERERRCSVFCCGCLLVKIALELDSDRFRPTMYLQVVEYAFLRVIYIPTHTPDCIKAELGK